jgi:integrase
MGKLTVIKIRSITAPGRYGDGAGLHLHVRSATRKNWVLRYMINGQSRDMGLGSFPDVSLADARSNAAEAQAQIRAGIDPIESRRVPPPPEDRSFRAVAAELIEDKKIGWRNPKHTWQWENTLARHVYPTVGDRLVGSVTTEDVMDILRPLWGKTPETASRLRGRIEAVIDAARAKGWYAGENPARWKGHLSTRLPSPLSIRRVEHYPSLPWQQIGDFMAQLDRHHGFSARSLAFAILTGARSGEVRELTWREIDLDSATWTVPGPRMKGGRPHRVPLSSGAMEVLERVQPDQSDPASFVFPGSKGAPQSLMAMVVLVRRMNGERTDGIVRWKDGMTGEPIVPHGFRSTLRDWAAEATPYPREVAEAALAHAKGNKVEAAYARSDLLERRRPMMEDWSRVCLGNVMPVSTDHSL